MKLSSKDVAYSSLELNDPSSPSQQQQQATMRRNMASNTSTSSLQSTISSSSSATVMDSMASPRSSFFASHVRNHAPAGLEGLVRQLAVEVKGALLATGYVLRLSMWIFIC